MLFRNIKHHLPILKQIYLGINNGTETGVIDIFQDAPQLEQVFLYGPTTADISLPWPQIKTFINRDPLVCNGKPNYPVMSESSIVDLRVLRVTHQDLLAFWPERTLRYLETLHLDFMSRVGGTPGTDHDNFLGSLTLPKVSTISVTNYPGKLLPALFALMSRSFSGTSYMLTTLKLCHSLTFIELLSLSRVATSLETLVTCLPLSADSEGLLQLAFCPESHYSLRLPNLQKLHFFVTEEYHILTVSQIKGLTQIAETRCEIVETRNRQHPPLWKVRRLKDFRVVFPSAWECIVGQEALEAKRQYSLSPKSIQRIEFIADWLGPTDLNMVIKLFKHSHGSPLTHKNARKKRWFARFRGVEDDMCDIFNVAELYVCDDCRSTIAVGIYMSSMAGIRDPSLPVRSLPRQLPWSGQ